MRPPDVGAGGGTPFGTRVIHYGADELISVSDGEITSSVQEGTQHTHPLSSILPDLIDVR